MLQVPEFYLRVSLLAWRGKPPERGAHIDKTNFRPTANKKRNAPNGLPLWVEGAVNPLPSSG